MDQEALVKGGQALIRYLDQTQVAPRLAMWVNFSDTGRWRLWIVPKSGFLDKREFYRIVATVLSAHPEETQGLDVSSVEMVGDDRPVVKGMRNFIRAPGIIAARMGGNTVNGVYVPDGVLLRSNL
jgi:hypothetical protein